MFNSSKLYFHNQLLPILEEGDKPKPRKKGQKKKGKKTKVDTLKSKYGDDIIVKLLLLLLGREKKEKKKETKKKAKLDTAFKGMRRARGGGGQFATPSQVRKQREEAEKKEKKKKADLAIAVASIPQPGDDEEDVAERVKKAKIAATDDPVEKVLYELTGSLNIPKLQGLQGRIAYLGIFAEPLQRTTNTPQQQKEIEREVVNTITGFRGADFEKKFKPDPSKGKDTEIKRAVRSGDKRLREIYGRTITAFPGFTAPPASAPSFAPTTSTAATETLLASGIGSFGYSPKPSPTTTPDVSPRPTAPSLQEQEQLIFGGGGGQVVGGGGRPRVSTSRRPPRPTTTSQPIGNILSFFQQQQQPQAPEPAPSSPSLTRAFSGGGFNNFSLNQDAQQRAELEQQRLVGLQQQREQQLAFEMEAQLEEAKQRSIEQQGRRTIPVARRIITAPVSSESEAQAQREQQAIIKQNQENIGRRGRPYVSSESESEGTKQRRVLSRSSVGNAIYSALSNQGYVPNYTQVEQPVISSSESGSESSGSDKPPGPPPAPGQPEGEPPPGPPPTGPPPGPPPKQPKGLTKKEQANMTKALANLDTIFQGQSFPIGQARTKKGGKSRAKPITDVEAEKAEIESMIRGSKSFAPSKLQTIIKNAEAKLSLGQSLVKTIEQPTKKAVKVGTTKGQFDRTNLGVQVRETGVEEKISDYFPEWDDITAKLKTIHHNTPEGRRLKAREKAIRDDFEWNMRDKLKGEPPSKDGYSDDASITSIEDAEQKFGYELPDQLKGFGETIRIRSGETIVGAGKEGIAVMTSSGFIRYIDKVTGIKQTETEVEPKPVATSPKLFVKLSAAPSDISSSDPELSDVVSSYNKNKRFIKLISKKQESGEIVSRSERLKYNSAVDWNKKYKRTRDANAAAQAAITGGDAGEGSSTEGYYTQSEGSEYGVPYSKLAEQAKKRGEGYKAQKDMEYLELLTQGGVQRIKGKGQRAKELKEEQQQRTKELQQEYLDAVASGGTYIEESLGLGGDFSERQVEKAKQKIGTQASRGESGYNKLLTELAKETDKGKQDNLRLQLGEVFRKYAKEKIIRDEREKGTSKAQAKIIADRLDVVSKSAIVQEAEDLIGRENLVVGTPIYEQIQKDFKKLKKQGKVSFEKQSPPTALLESSSEGSSGSEAEPVSKFGIKAPQGWAPPPEGYEDIQVYPKKFRGKYFVYEGDKKYSIDKEGRGFGNPDFDYVSSGELLEHQEKEKVAGKKLEFGTTNPLLEGSVEVDKPPKPVATSPKPRPKPPKEDKTKSKDWWERTARKFIEDSFEDNLKSSQGVTLQKAIQPKEYFSELKKETGRDERGELSLIRGLGRSIKGWDDPDLKAELESKGFTKGNSPGFNLKIEGMTEGQAIAELHRDKLKNIKSTDWYKREIEGFALPDFTEYATPKSQPKPVATSPKPRPKPKKVGTTALTQEQLKGVYDLYPKTPEETQPVLPGQVIPATAGLLETSLEFPAGSIGVLPADASIDVGGEGFAELDEYLGGGEFNVELDEEI